MAQTRATTDLSQHPIALFAEWIDAGGPGADTDEPAMVVAGWRVPLSLVEQWQAGMKSAQRSRYYAWRPELRRCVQREKAPTRWDAAWNVVDIAWRVLCYTVAGFVAFVIMASLIASLTGQ